MKLVDAIKIEIPVDLILDLRNVNGDMPDYLSAGQVPFISFLKVDCLTQSVGEKIWTSPCYR